jgi:hypothetical protein
MRTVYAEGGLAVMKEKPVRNAVKIIRGDKMRSRPNEGKATVT